MADTPGTAANTDPNLKNPWGVSSAPGGVFWVSDDRTGVSTLYSTSGAIEPLVVTIPTASGTGVAKVTGQVYNPTSDFFIPGQGPSQFIFASEDGSLSAWWEGTSATLVANQSTAGAVYTGLALASNGGANFLYAANFHSGEIDVFNTNFALTQSFTDSGVPSGFAPYNVSNIGGLLYVTFALQNATKTGAASGVGNGYVDVFNTNGTLKTRLVSTGALNSPWGLAMAPAQFGSLGGSLLVANLGDGTIHGYNPTSGQLVGQVLNTAGQPMTIGGLWALFFANGGSSSSSNTLYFTAGSNGYADGLLGTITPSASTSSQLRQKGSVRAK